MTPRYSLVQVYLPGRGLENAGVLLEDPAANAIHSRFRRDWEAIAGEDEAEVLELLAGDLSRKAEEMGGRALFDFLESSASNDFRITDPEAVAVEDFDRAVNRLYREHIPSKILQFRTHVPRYSLRVAAGKFLDNAEVSEEEWVEAPEDLRLTPDLFAARIAGQSMEPTIPDGSLCIFRAGAAGSRQGRRVLVENLETSGTNRYTVKRYVSEKSSTEAGWRHTRIRLESLNPGFPSWDLDPDEDKYRIVAEFVRVLE